MNLLKTKKHKINDWKKATLYVVYIISFLVSFHIALTLYVESLFLESILRDAGFLDPSKFIGLIYTGSAIFTIILFINISKVLRKVGNFPVAITFVFLEILALLILAFFNDNITLTIVAFIIHLLAINIITFTVDLFIENFSSDDSTGSIRGILLTTSSIAFILAPFISGLIITNGDFWKLFFASGIIIAPTLILLIIKFHDYPDPEYDHAKLLPTLKEIWERKNIFHIFIIGFLLRFFYVWMVIYTPLYLHNVMGIPNNEIIGIIIPIAILPFVMFEYILGKLADTKYGEKEILIIGFIIAAVATFSVSFITSSNIYVWAAILFGTRVGASFVEIMSETYFFKKIDATDAYLIGYFRNVRPLAYLIAPIVATGVLFFLDFQQLFIVLAGFMLYGIVHASMIEDTK